MSFLLDANALIAMGWPAHEHHERMIRWFAEHAEKGWATTAFTEAAFVRVITQPTFAGFALGVDEVAEVLLRNLAHPCHRRLPMNFGFEQVLASCTGGILGPRQITDAYLLTAAIRQRSKLVTFDGMIASLLATSAEREAHVSALGPE